MIAPAQPSLLVLRFARSGVLVATARAVAEDGALALEPEGFEGVRLGLRHPLASLVGFDAAKGLRGGEGLRLWSDGWAKTLEVVERDGRWVWVHAGVTVGTLEDMPMRKALSEEQVVVLYRAAGLPIPKTW